MEISQSLSRSGRDISAGWTGPRAELAPHGGTWRVSEPFLRPVPSPLVQTAVPSRRDGAAPATPFLPSTPHHQRLLRSALVACWEERMHKHICLHTFFLCFFGIRSLCWALLIWHPEIARPKKSLVVISALSLNFRSWRMEKCSVGLKCERREQPVNVSLVPFYCYYFN